MTQQERRKKLLHIIRNDWMPNQIGTLTSLMQLDIDDSTSQFTNNDDYSILDFEHTYRDGGSKHRLLKDNYDIHSLDDLREGNEDIFEMTKQIVRDFNNLFTEKNNTPLSEVLDIVEKKYNDYIQKVDQEIRKFRESSIGHKR